MFADLRFFWKAQQASAFMLAVSLCSLLAAAVGAVAQIALGRLAVGVALAACVGVGALAAWMLGAANLAVARQWRLTGTKDTAD